MSGGSERAVRQVVRAEGRKGGRERWAVGRTGSGGEGRGRCSMCGGIDSVTAARRSRFVASKKLQGDLRER